MAEFYQTAPTLHHPFQNDLILQSFLKRRLPSEVLSEIQPDLIRFGQRIMDEVEGLGNTAENNPPRHIPYDAWGKRIDTIEVSDAWKKLDRISAEEKLIAIGYERKWGAYSRIYQFAKLYLFHPSSAIYTCPLAMTDGAAKVIERFGNEELRKKVLSRLTSSDPDQFWTSGQWMTERTGGSDVSQTSTLAKKKGTQYRLYGTKWFTSATTAQISLALARTEEAPEGSRGLSLFCLELRNANGELNEIQVHRLKDKLGTRALPTAELTLNGTPATLVGEIGQGVKTVSSLLNITRIYNACCAVGYMRRGLSLALDYAQKRKAFGKPLIEHPLHRETLSQLSIEFEGSFLLVFHLIEMLGREETGAASPKDLALLRILTPLAKLFTAKKAVAFASEILECFGGAGYVEDTGLPSLLRNSQVLSIWEGTTNVLCLDLLRALDPTDASKILIETMKDRVRASPGENQKILYNAVDQIETYLRSEAFLDPEAKSLHARRFAFLLATTYIGTLYSESVHTPQEKIRAQSWIERIATLPTFVRTPSDNSLILDNILRNT